MVASFMVTSTLVTSTRPNSRYEPFCCHSVAASTAHLREASSVKVHRTSGVIPEAPERHTAGAAKMSSPSEIIR